MCDVDEDRLEAAVKRVGGAVQGYRDYRHILNRKDIDAVVIATPGSLARRAMRSRVRDGQTRLRGETILGDHRRGQGHD